MAEFYPSRRDPVMGIWAHRQALAVREAGAEVRVIVLHRIVPPRAALAEGVGKAASTLREMLGEPRHQLRDGLPVTYASYVSPPRERGYPDWGAWAAPSLALALRRLRRSFPYELIHAHNAVPAGDAVRRAGPRTPLVVSEHGADVLYTAWRGPRGARAVARGLGAAQLVLANSGGIAELARDRGAARTRVVHLGAELPPARGPAGDNHATASGASATGAAHARDRRPPGGPQAPRRRAAGAGGARTAAPDAALLDRRRRGPSARRWRRWRPAWGWPSAWTSTVSSIRPRRSRRRAARPYS